MTAIFVNRKDELETIRRLIRQNRPKLLLSITGEGGVGKTTLLRQVWEEFQPDPAYYVLAIDFDLPENQNLHALRETIARSFPLERLAAYQRAIEDLKQIEQDEDASEQRRVRIENDTWKLFYDGMAEAQKGRPRIFLCDTMERIQDTDLFNDFLDILQKIDNTVVLAAGRGNEAITSELKRAIGAPDYFDHLDILPFAPEASEDYFMAALGQQLDALTQQKLHILTGGKPIYLGLAATWLSRREAIDKSQLPPWRQFLDWPLEEIEAHREQYKRLFEEDLVAPLSDLNSLQNWAVLYMALMSQPFDREMAQALLQIDEEAADQLVDELGTLFFVRADKTLHDEMRQLVLRNVWSTVDRTGSRIESSLRVLLDLAQKRMAEAETSWDKNFREAEVLHILLVLDLQRGFEEFIHSFDRAYNARAYVKCHLLLQTVEGIQTRRLLSTDRLNEIMLRRIRLHSRLEQGDRVEVECQQLLKQSELTPRMQIEALSLSAFMLRAVDPVESSRRYEEALKLARKIGDEPSVASLYNFAGMVWRRLDEFEKATRYLRQSIDRAEKLGLWQLKGNAMNNLAYVYRQRTSPKLHDTAFNWALAAHNLRQHLDDRVGLAYSKQTLGEIYRDFNDLSKATDYLNDARRLFETQGKDKEVADVDLQLAIIDRKEHRPQQAEETLKRVIAVSQRLKDREILSRAHNEYGCALRTQGREKSRDDGDHESAWKLFSLAEEQFHESLSYANAYRRSDNLADLALLYHYWLLSLPALDDDKKARQAMWRKAEDCALSAIEIARDKKLLLPESRALETQGDLRYDYEHKYFKAYALYYFPACELMAPFYGSDLFRYRVVFERVKRHLMNPAIGDEQSCYIARYMARRWSEAGLNRVAKGFSRDLTWIADNWKKGVP
jgi:tetratricopeptide (TPR) repeat protein